MLVFENPTSHNDKKTLSSSSGHLVKITTRNGPIISKTALNNYSKPILLAQNEIRASSNSLKHLSGKAKTAFFNSDLQNFESTKLSPRLNLNQSSAVTTPTAPMPDNSQAVCKISNNNTDDIDYPITKEEALRLCRHRLSIYEKTEIEQYDEIWYLGLSAFKIPGEEDALQNRGYDDSNGNYQKVYYDHIAYRYEILELLGRGSFGQVIRAFDHKTKEFVAIKIIRNRKRFKSQALIEIAILKELRRKEVSDSNVVHMLDHFEFRNHLCITFELLNLNLYDLIRQNNYNGFSLNLIKRFGHSLLMTLRFLKKLNIIHCDLKPENIMLRRRGSSWIKVIDFGSSCFTHERVYSYIQSRFYRAPEIILGLDYSTAIDMWSFGCILAELYTGYPLFPGENEVEQLACQMEVLGPPPDDLIAKAKRRRLFFDSKGNPRCISNSKGRKRKPGSKSLASVLRCSDKNFVDLVSSCLRWNPDKRCLPIEALCYPFMVESVEPKLSELIHIPHSHSDVNVSNESHSSSSSISGSSNSRTHKCMVQQKSDKVRAKIIDTRPHHSSTTKLDSNLNNSGTYLRPIL